MRVDDLYRAPVMAGLDEPEQSAQQQRSQEKDSVGRSDQADVSHLAQSLAAPDPERIEQLRLQVQSGNYDVSAQAVAHALIEAHLKDE